MERPSSLIPAVWYNYSSYNELLNRSRQLQQQPVSQTTHTPTLASMVVQQQAHSSVPGVSLQIADGIPKPKKIRRRENYEGKERTFICNQCPAAFHTQSKLNTHMRIHSGIKPYVCDVCDKAFIQGSNLKAHKRIHTGERPYGCDECGKTFRASSYLVVHKRIHSGEKPYICGFCGKGFYMSTYLANHIRIHTGETPYECEYCGETFSQSLDCRMHKRIHTGEKPVLKCRECNITFVKGKDYRSHKKEFHSRSKPFKCQVCDKGFSSITVVNRHQYKCKGPTGRKAKGRPRKRKKKVVKKEVEEPNPDKPKRIKRKKNPKLPAPTDRVTRTRTKTLREPEKIKEEPEIDLSGESSDQRKGGIDINDIVKELGIEGFTKEALEEIPNEVIQTIPKESITQELLKDLLEKKDQQKNNVIDYTSLSAQHVNGSSKMPMVTVHPESLQSSQEMMSSSQVYMHQQHQQVIPVQQSFVHHTLQPQVITSDQQIIPMQENITVISDHQNVLEPAEQISFERHQPYAVDLSNITTTQYSRT